MFKEMKNQVTINNIVPLRLNRSELAVPGSRPEIFEKAAESNSDVIFLDLEDAVSVERKNKARESILEAIRNINWKNKSYSCQSIFTNHSYVPQIKDNNSRS